MYEVGIPPPHDSEKTHALVSGQQQQQQHMRGQANQNKECYHDGKLTRMYIHHNTLHNTEKYCQIYCL